MEHDQFSVSERSWIMSRIKSTNTKAELLLRRELWKKGLRYRVNYKRVIGKPDIFFRKARVVVFVDGAFWHGKKLSEERLSRMSKYWQDKIHKNRERDESITCELEQRGYNVLRFDEQIVLKDAPRLAAEIERIIRAT